jgi:Sodium:sulfate symporter transmembrane region
VKGSAIGEALELHYAAVALLMGWLCMQQELMSWQPGSLLHSRCFIEHVESCSVMPVRTVCWPQAFGDNFGVSPLEAALLAVSLLFLGGALSWKDCLQYGAAWDTFFWFSGGCHTCWCRAACGLAHAAQQCVRECACYAGASLPDTAAMLWQLLKDDIGTHKGKQADWPAPPMQT